MRLELGVVALLGMGVFGAAYGAAAAAPDRASFTAVYRVTAVTHSSSSRKNDPPYYNGSSTSNWTLAPATASASNLVGVSVQGPIVYGAGRVNVRGVFRAQATSNRPGRCSLTAATGSKKYPAVAPAAFPLTIAADPKANGRVLVIQGPGFNVHATLGNPYFPSECSTTITGEPEPEETSMKSVPRSTFSQKTVVLRYAGSTSRDGIAYRWSTVFTLKRVKFSSG